MLQQEPEDDPPAQALVTALASRVAAMLPHTLHSLLRTRQGNLDHPRLLLNCELTLVEPDDPTCRLSQPLTSIDLTPLMTSSLAAPSTRIRSDTLIGYPSPAPSDTMLQIRPAEPIRPVKDASTPGHGAGKRGVKRKAKLTVNNTCSAASPEGLSNAQSSSDRDIRFAEEIFAASPTDAALNKLLNGIWQSLFSDTRPDPGAFFEESQAIADSANIGLLGGPEGNEVVVSDSNTSAARTVFSRINMIARKISQMSQVCRAMEISVLARWIQCFDDRVQALALRQAPDAARKRAMLEACSDLGWSEKEMRNKMCIWRGYEEIARYGGFVTLIFAGPGLYRFCKYRMSFNEASFQKLRALRPAFELVADTLHPSWRNMPDILDIPHERKYTGHIHDWVLGGPGGELMTLASTYRKWDPDFSYGHINESVVDEDAWVNDDPRRTCPADSAEVETCRSCGEHQANDNVRNRCNCFPNLYGQASPKQAPVLIGQTKTGKNNGLFACLDIAKGEALGEFVGQITKGVAGADVMFGQTDKATYQIWQGERGNYTRFVNHSCRPNSQYEHFNWCGTQRIVLVSLGIKAGDEITVDYSDTYWQAS